MQGWGVDNEDLDGHCRDSATWRKKNAWIGEEKRGRGKDIWDSITCWNQFGIGKPESSKGGKSVRITGRSRKHTLKEQKERIRYYFRCETRL